jgi:hypothetical protein
MNKLVQHAGTPSTGFTGTELLALPVQKCKRDEQASGARREISSNLKSIYGKANKLGSIYTKQ